jgi:hypothetical protein
MKIRIDVDGGAVTATLDNNSQAAKDFIALHPVRLKPPSKLPSRADQLVTIRGR